MRHSAPLHQLPGQFEAEIHPAGAHMKQQVARRGHGDMPRAGDLAERVQLRWAGSSEKHAPRVRPDPNDTGPLAVPIAEPDRTNDASGIGQQISHLGNVYRGARWPRTRSPRQPRETLPHPAEPTRIGAMCHRHGDVIGFRPTRGQPRQWGLAERSCRWKPRIPAPPFAHGGQGRSTRTRRVVTSRFGRRTLCAGRAG